METSALRAVFTAVCDDIDPHRYASINYCVTVPSRCCWPWMRCRSTTLQTAVEGNFLSFRSVSTKESYTDRSSVYATTPKTFNLYLYQTRSQRRLAREL